MSECRGPVLQAPADACDSGIHIYDSAVPIAPGARAPAWATVAAYRAVQKRLGITRTIVVQPTAYGIDNDCTLKAVAALCCRDRSVRAWTRLR